MPDEGDVDYKGYKNVFQWLAEMFSFYNVGRWVIGVVGNKSKTCKTTRYLWKVEGGKPTNEVK